MFSTTSEAYAEHYMRSQPLLVLIGLTLLISGCNGYSNGPRIEGPPADSLATVEEETYTSVTDIVIDATPSMRGFASDPQYQNFVTLSLANASNADGRVEYHQLTTALPEGIRAVDDKMRAAQPVFYAQGNTDLSTALDSLNPNGLTVLVTDLFQSSGDMNAVSQAITRRAFEQGLAVGVFGSRFSFEGRIYDVGPDAQSFDFDGRRPLYGLVFGSPRAVSNYFENLRQSVDSEKYKFLLFSSRIVERSGRLRIRNSDTVENLVRVRSKLETKVDMPLSSARTLGLRIRENVKPARLDARLDMDVLPAVHPLLDRGSVKAKVTEVWKRGTESRGYVTDFERHSLAIEALRANVVWDDSTKLRVQIRPEDLNNGSYGFNIAIEVQKWQLPEWVAGWNLSPSEFQKPDGSKTANLLPFLRDLGSSLTSASRPRVATLQAYVEKQ